MTLSEIERAVVRCTRCPELCEYTARVARERKRAHRDCEYWGKPVPSFGPANARIVLVGLAPGAHGSNRTGRPFTGDASGDFLYPALYRAGLSSQPNATNRNDGLVLLDCFVTAAARCAPPANKPTPQELRNCFPYLVSEFSALTSMRVAIGLGAIGFDATLRALRECGFALDPPKPKFAHGAEAAARKGKRVVVAIASYHPSRQNTNTGVLTVPMFDAIFARAVTAARRGGRTDR
ncbi:MAG: uracil-DNA glycosylase [Candidatus Eremiobacteraeota bacterium]|nr:uracil-DNA glycosylase [Candidatus Eremiobacteraeota bacterium]